jgi:hypothetical protein
MQIAVRVRSLGITWLILERSTMQRERALADLFRREQIEFSFSENRLL